MSHMFRVGDRVIAIDSVDGYDNLVGKTGTVVHIRSGFANIGVEFDEEFTGGHDCHRKARAGRGRYGEVSSFQIYEEEDLEVPEEDTLPLSDFLSEFIIK